MADVKQLPKKEASLDAEGLYKLKQLFASDPKLALVLAESLAEDPRAAAEQLFRLSANQAAALEKTSDAELQKIVEPLIEVIKSGKDFSGGMISYTVGARTAPPSLVNAKVHGEIVCRVTYDS